MKNRRLDLSYDTDINVKNAYSFNFHWTHHFDGFDVKYVGGYSQYDYSLSLNNFLTGDSSIKSYQLPTYTLAQVPITSGNVCGYINAVGGACAPLTVDGNQGFNYDSKVKWYSQELNFASTGGGKFSWIAGLYYYNETDNNPETETATTQPQLTAAGFNVIPVSGATTYIPSLLGAAPPVGKSIFNPRQAGDYLFLDYQDMIQSTAGFGQVSYKITDTIKVTGGVRYTYDYKDAQEEAATFSSPTRRSRRSWARTRRRSTSPRCWFPTHRARESSAASASPPPVSTPATRSASSAIAPAP